MKSLLKFTRVMAIAMVMLLTASTCNAILLPIGIVMMMEGGVVVINPVTGTIIVGTAATVGAWKLSSWVSNWWYDTAGDVVVIIDPAPPDAPPPF